MTENEKLYALSEKERQRKEAFVCDYLAPLLRAAGVGVQNAEYHTEGGDETVTIFYKSGNVKVCVSCDSLPALARDVLRRI